jgi:sugar lactone lactonase YvrE
MKGSSSSQPSRLHAIALFALSVHLVALSSCGGGDDGSGSTPTAQVGGSVSGLAMGATLTLTDNGTDTLVIKSNGSFDFATALSEGTSYSVVVSSQPTTQLCTVTGGAGSVSSAPITSVRITCIGPFTVGGTLSGLTSESTLVLTDNDKDSLSITANGAFTFATPLAPGATYSVAIAGQPMGDHCSLSNETGTVSTGNITNVQVTCEPPALAVLAGGLGGPGNIDGTGTAARLNNPTDVAVDAGGNFYVADFANATVRKVTAAGAVTTLAGSAGQIGTAEGTGSAARFNDPSWLTVNSSGTLYVSDEGANTIRSVSAGSVVTTLAGMPYTSGTANGAGATARFSNPSGIKIAPSGAIYVADSHLIRSITPQGDVSTIFSGGGQLADLAFDSSGNLFATDISSMTVVKINLATNTETILASGFDGPLNVGGPRGIAVAPAGTTMAGTIYAAVPEDQSVIAIAPDGKVSTLAGSGTNAQAGGVDGTGAAARFYYPLGLTIDATGTILVADTNNNAIRKVTPDGVVTTVAGGMAQKGDVDGTGVDARFSEPSAVATDTNGNLYVADSGNATIRKVTPAGVVTQALPAGLAVYTQTLARDSNGNFYVPERNAILKVTSSGVVTTIAGEVAQAGYRDGTGSAAVFDAPTGITVDGSGNLYVVDTGNFVIRKVTPSGVVTTFAGSPFSRGTADGTGTAAQFTSPGVVVIDSNGALYLTDGNAIREISPSAAVTTLAGSQVAGSTDGAGVSATFSAPYGLAVGPAGSLYVSDTSNHEIRKITGAGVVTTIAGSAARTGVSVGLLPASLNRPLGIAYFGGALYIVDNTENSILVIPNVP